VFTLKRGCHGCNGRRYKNVRRTFGRLQTVGDAVPVIICKTRGILLSLHTHWPVVRPFVSGNLLIDVTADVGEAGKFEFFSSFVFLPLIILQQAIISEDVHAGGFHRSR
jgi:hypothetical protein